MRPKTAEQPKTRKPWTPKANPLRRARLRRIGRKTLANIAANQISKAQVEKEGLEFCWLCGSGFNLQRSHSDKRRFNPVLTHVAILDGECHSFIEYRLDAATRKAVNDKLIELREADGEYRFEEALKLMPPDRARELREKLEEKKYERYENHRHCNGR